MPKKGHRAASRQAQLRRRRRRGKGGPEIFAAGPITPTEPSVVEEPAAEAEFQPESVAEPAPQPTESVRRSRQRASTEAVPVYTYLRAELRRISIIAGLILVILAILTVVLGS